MARGTPSIVSIPPDLRASTPSLIIPNIPSASATGSGFTQVSAYTVWGQQPGVPSPADLRATANQNTNALTCAAMDAFLPIPYGAPRMTGLLADMLVDTPNQRYVFPIIWGEGEVVFDSITVNDQPITTANYGVNYTGAASQAYDALLANAYGQKGVTWALPLIGVSYSVLAFPWDSVTTPPKFNAIGGIKIYDPRLDSTNGGTGSHRLADATSWARSSNPSLILADFLRRQGYTFIWSTVIAAANANDVMLGTAPNVEKSRVCDIIIDRPAYIDSWKETLRAAAGVFIVENQGVIKLVPDATGAPVQAFSRTAGNIVSMGQPSFPDPTNMPTVVDVQFTDATALPWKTDTATANRPGVDDGSVPFVRATVPMPWIKSRSQANREAIEYLNKVWLRSMTFPMEVFDEGLAVEVGEIDSVDDAEFGYSMLPVRVMQATPTDRGTWILNVNKEDVGAYSTTVQVNPTTPNTNLPLPNHPPAMGAISVTEDVYQTQDGYFSSRIKVTWAPTSWPFFSAFLVTLSQAGVQKDAATISDPDATSWLSGPQPEGLLYVVTVAIQSTTLDSGVPAIGSVTNNGKLALPSDVPGITGFEVGGEVRLNWSPATDLDLTAYEIRYGSTSDNWASSLLLDRVSAPSLRYSTKVIDPGTWRIFIKALDSVRTAAFPFGQQSVNAVYCDVMVTSDANAFLVGSYSFASATLSNMSAQRDSLGHTFWVTDMADTWNALFASAMSAYTNPLYSYHTSGASSLNTDHHDFAAQITGTWSGSATWSIIGPASSGTTSANLDLDTTDGSYATTAALTTTQSSTDRWAKVRIYSADVGTILVTGLGVARVTAVTRNESALISISANPTAIVFQNTYTKLTNLQLQATGTTSIQCVPDAVTGTGFNAYAFNTSTGAAASFPVPAYYQASGV
jgi:hypothetical protein